MATPKTFNDLAIINQALTGAMGEARITDLSTDADTKGIVMRENYEAVSEACQVKSAWRFNTVKVALNKLAAAPLNRWSAAWQLPVDRLKILFTWAPSRYEIQGDLLYSNNTDAVHLDYQRKLTEDEWPTWFQRYVVARLVMRTVKGITGEDPSQAMKDEEKDALDDALFQDSQQQPNQTILPNDFVDVRH